MRAVGKSQEGGRQMSDDLELYVAPLNGRPYRLVQAKQNGKEIFRDSIDTDSAWAREKFAKAVAERYHGPAKRLVFEGNYDIHGLEWLPAKLVELAEEADQKALAEIEGAGGDDLAPRFKIYTSAELDSLEFNEPAIINNAKIEGQPGGVFGGTKTLKTSIVADGAFSVATGTNFLGCDFFTVPRARRVMFMSAESGLKAIQRLARRIAASRGYELSEVENLLWCPTVPFIGSDRDCATIGKIIKDHGIEWAIFDPLYMMLDGRDANNLYAQGVQFRRLQEACRETGAEFDLLHHNSRASARCYDPPTLNDAQWSGISEFVGQWWQLARRERYVEKSGLHRLWFSLGARGDFQNLWAIDVNEHADQWGRPQGWSVEVRPSGDVQTGNTREKAQQKEQAAQQKLDADRQAIVNVMAKHPAGETKTFFRQRSPLSPERFNVVWATLFDDDTIIAGEAVKKGNGPSYPTFKLRADSDV